MIDDMDRRQLILALSALTFSGCSSSEQKSVSLNFEINLDLDQSSMIARSYTKSVSRHDRKQSREGILRHKKLEIPALENLIESDFSFGRVFQHKGWFLSYTEGQLFLMLSESTV